MTPMAVVTGAAGAIGTAIAARLSDAGYALLLVDRDPKVGETASQLRSFSRANHAFCVADLSTAAGVALLADVARGTGRAIAVLVNNAGITRDSKLSSMTEGNFAAVIELNLVAAMRLTFTLEGDMPKGASIVNISSRASLGNFGQVNYVTSKAALVGFTRSMALRLAPRVRVNAVAPGLIDTPMARAIPEHVLDRLVQRVPMGRMGSPGEVAEIVSFLASPAAAYITGQVLFACGGRSLM